MSKHLTNRGFYVNISPLKTNNASSRVVEGTALRSPTTCVSESFKQGVKSVKEISKMRSRKNFQNAFSPKAFFVVFGVPEKTQFSWGKKERK